MYYTEEGIPVRTIYLSNISIDVTRQILCEYFRQFGAVERAQIVTERLKLLDILPALGQNGFVDTPPSQRRNYAYVTFVNALGAYEALNIFRHVVQDREIHVEQAFSWKQPGFEVEKYLNQNQSSQKDNLFNEIDKALNDDCILKIMSYLDICELASLSKYSFRFKAIAHLMPSLRICRQPHEGMITLMELRNILRLHDFGHSITRLTISLESFSSPAHICDRLFQYIGPQLRSLTLVSSSHISPSHLPHKFEILKPILFQLTHLEIDFDYKFDNRVWPNLKTLRLSSSGFGNIKSMPEFPSLTKLTIISWHQLYEDYFERLHRACANITELVVVHIEDPLWAKLVQMHLVTVDFDRLSDFKEVIKLHLSIGRSYLTEKLIDIISTMSKLEHLTLEIAKNVSQTLETTDDSEADDRILKWNGIKLNFNCNLRKIGTGLPNIKEVRLSEITLKEENLIELIEHAPKLESLYIHECNIVLSSLLIDSIVNKRREVLNTQNGQREIKPLTLIVNEFSDPVVSNMITEDHIKQYLIVQKHNNKNIISMDL